MGKAFVHIFTHTGNVDISMVFSNMQFKLVCCLKIHAGVLAFPKGEIKEKNIYTLEEL